MRPLRRFLQRLANFAARRPDDARLQEEIAAHVALQTAENLRSGLSPSEARRQALLKFGAVESIKEDYRAERGLLFLETLWQDLRFAFRMLRKSPGFTAVAVLTLALGIGANTAIFSMVNGILLRALPYSQPTQLYALHEFVPQWPAYPSLPVNGGNFLAWEKESHAFLAMTLINSSNDSLLGTGRPQWLNGAEVSSDFFSVLGAQPQMGRAFVPEDEGSGGKPEIILTHQLWQEQFHSDRNILGKVINLGGRGMTVIGVLPANFIFPHILAHDPEYLVPLPWAQWNTRPGIGNHNCSAIARLKDGVTPSEAKAQLDVIEARIAQKDSGGKFNLYAILTPLKTEIVGPMQKSLWMFTFAAALVLLIVCANLANLLLVKNGNRLREVALRSAFGAGHRRLVRQFLTETLVLASAGGALGLLFADGALRLLVRNAPVGIPRVNQIRLDSTVLWFTLAVMILAAFIFGLLPSLRATRVPLADALKSAGPTASVGKRATRLRSALVIGEIALCAALLPACLLLIESLRHVALANQWMNEEHVITAKLFVQIRFTHPARDNGQRAFEERNHIFTSIEEKVAQLPGVESVGLTNDVPLEGFDWGDSINVQEIPLPDAEQPSGEFRFVSPGYFRAIELPLMKGRFFTESDRGQPVAVISENVARDVFGRRDPVGMHVSCSNFSFGAEWCRVVGVVGDMRDESDQAPALAAYFPLWLFSEDAETLVVRTNMSPASAAGAIRQAIWSVDPDLAIPEEKTLKTILASAEAPRRYETSLVTLFALCAVLLAMLGLYAVISYSVSQRTHEIGIRMALGAQRGEVLRMVVREGALLAGFGTVAGIGGALAWTRFLQSLLFEIKPTDAPTFVAVAILLTLVAMAASYMPARRAMRVDPMVALRYE
ncbi:MAG TPA: ABC transporter permease [Candidatus Acidoferrales bacterium]|nr:ABC transporter permease [Candidatus Acidoferrales bacterium]